MPTVTRNFTFAPGEYYHVYNRGTEKRRIYLDRKDYERFLALLYICNTPERVDLKLQGRTLEKILKNSRPRTLVDVAAYCLMPNHFHLLIRVKGKEDASLFMQKLLTGYTMYFNKRRNRTGALFQGKFKAQHVNDDEYLKYLIAYIHLNPVKITDTTWKENGITNIVAAQNFLDTYRYSSFLDYGGRHERPESKIIDRTSMPQYFETFEDMKDDALEWLKA